MLEVAPAVPDASELPVRGWAQEQATTLSTALPLKPTSPDPHLDVRFSDAARFERQKLVKKQYNIPKRAARRSRRSRDPGHRGSFAPRRSRVRYSPVVCEIVQPRLRIGAQNVPLTPTPDGRQFGNTQKANGCSWVVLQDPFKSTVASRADVLGRARLPPTA